MRMKAEVYLTVDQSGLKVTEATRWMADYWNSHLDRNTHERLFCGWYWWPKDEPNLTYGPFKTWSAAYRDAYERVGLRDHTGNPKALKTAVRDYIRAHKALDSLQAALGEPPPSDNVRRLRA
jgi:hypothetical protein